MLDARRKARRTMHPRCQNDMMGSLQYDGILRCAPSKADSTSTRLDVGVENAEPRRVSELHCELREPVRGTAWIGVAGGQRRLVCRRRSQEGKNTSAQLRTNNASLRGHSAACTQRDYALQPFSREPTFETNTRCRGRRQPPMPSSSVLMSCSRRRRRLRTSFQYQYDDRTMMYDSRRESAVRSRRCRRESSGM